MEENKNVKEKYKLGLRLILAYETTDYTWIRKLILERMGYGWVSESPGRKSPREH